MPNTPHLDKLDAACRNVKCEAADVRLIEEAKERYRAWKAAEQALTATGKPRVIEMTRLLNEYKDFLEVELIAARGSAFIKRQKGQLKLDNSVLEEFLIDLTQPAVLTGLPDFPLTVGPNTAFMSLSFAPPAMRALNEAPVVAVKVKDQDFIIGKEIHYRFSPDPAFAADKTATGSLSLAVLAAETKVNLDKTMFQEAAGTASRLKQGCPYSQYYILNEYLDMEAEDCRLTAIDNVFLLRHAKRLPFEKRSVLAEVRRQHENSRLIPKLSGRSHRRFRRSSMQLGMTRQPRCREVRSYDNDFLPSFCETAEYFLLKSDGKHPLLSDRRNIVVIADEAHRCQYDFIDGFAKESGDKNTQAVFGDYIDVYDILQSKEDKATVPIYYEARLAKIDLKPEERPKIDPNLRR